MKHRFTYVIIGLLLIICAPACAQELKERRNSISIFGSAEYGLDVRSIASPAINYRDGFFHSAGFYFKHNFGTKWYIQPGICYTQILLSDVSRTATPVTQKVHRLGVSLYAGYYILNKNRWSIGVGGGVQALYNLAAVRWNGAFTESAVVHLTEADIYTIGLELNAHAIFSYRLGKKVELYSSPFIQVNALPVFKANTDVTLRMGLTLGLGYLF